MLDKGRMIIQVGDLVRQNSNNTMWVVTKKEYHDAAPNKCLITLQNATLMDKGVGGSRVDYPMYYEVVCRPESNNERP